MPGYDPSTPAGSTPSVPLAPARRVVAGVRPLGPRHLGEIAGLHRRAFGERPRDGLEAFLGQVFFGHPWIEDARPSLGYLDAGGRLIGCLGVMPRPMVFGRARISAVVTHNFMVDPDHRRGLVAIRLMRALMRREPDLVVAEGNETARRICEALGGETVASRSGRWLRILRPVGLAAHVLGRQAPVRRLLSRLPLAPDIVARRPYGSRWRVGEEASAGTGPDPGLLSGLIERHTRRYSLRPAYSVQSLGWLIGTLKGTRRRQALRAGTVASGGTIVGWYLYFSRPGGVGRVLQLGAASEARRAVLRHLFAHATAEGNVALTGQSDPEWASVFPSERCLLRPGCSWVLAHGANVEIRRTLASPQAFFSRLEGEGWLRFAY